MMKSYAVFISERRGMRNACEVLGSMQAQGKRKLLPVQRGIVSDGNPFIGEYNAGAGYKRVQAFFAQRSAYKRD